MLKIMSIVVQVNEGNLTAGVHSAGHYLQVDGMLLPKSLSSENKNLCMFEVLEVPILLFCLKFQICGYSCVTLSHDPLSQFLPEGPLP